jgi:hypothetical protein
VEVTRKGSTKTNEATLSTLIGKGPQFPCFS